MRKFKYENLDITKLYINPDNYRYIEEEANEIAAIIAMFNVNIGEPQKEMINLAKDIVRDGLNPFEMPVVCFDSKVGKYIVYDGNRRITCLKLMTQYKGNLDILREIPTVAEIYKLQYDGDMEIQCVVYENADDAKYFLSKIHNDVNNGIGRKPWDAQAKMKANAIAGNRTEAYAIVEFLKKNPNTSVELIDMINHNRWISKLQRVVEFSVFKETYNIRFDNNKNISYLDVEEQVLKMLSKLVYDVITKSATGNFRHKKDFQEYVDRLPDEYKTQVKRQNTNGEKDNVDGPEKDKSLKEQDKSAKNKGEDGSNRTDDNIGIGKPKKIPHRHAKTKEALVLSKTYDYSAYECLNEKGREILIELESLNIKEYPVAGVALCRCILEYTLKLWLNEYGGEFNSSKLPSCYNGCINILRSNKIITNKEASVLSTKINKEDFITLLNTWMHADTEACVSETVLVSGWKNVRLLIEKYIEMHKK